MRRVAILLVILAPLLAGTSCPKEAMPGNRSTQTADVQPKADAGHQDSSETEAKSPADTSGGSSTETGGLKDSSLKVLEKRVSTTRNQLTQNRMMLSQLYQKTENIQKSVQTAIKTREGISRKMRQRFKEIEQLTQKYQNTVTNNSLGPQLRQFMERNLEVILSVAGLAGAFVVGLFIVLYLMKPRNMGWHWRSVLMGVGIVGMAVPILMGLGVAMRAYFYGIGGI